MEGRPEQALNGLLVSRLPISGKDVSSLSR